MLDVLLTVPHGAPGNDRGAPAVAHALHERLEKRGYKVRTLISKTCRYNAFDMNRGEARGSQYRSEIRRCVEQDHPTIHIDVHSFPDQIPRFGYQDIVLLHGFEHPDQDKPLQNHGWLQSYAKLLCALPGVAACVQASEYPNDLSQDVILNGGQARNRSMLAEHFDDGDPNVYAAAHCQALAQVLAGINENYDGRSGPNYKALVKGKVKLTPEERALVKERKAEWSDKRSAIFKSVVNDKTWYVTHTHRCYNVTPTLKGCIARFHDFVKGTAESRLNEGIDHECAQCGQWYVRDKIHDCDPEAPLKLGYAVAYLDAAEVVRDNLGHGFDSGTDGVTFDWEFEMLSAKRRLEIVAAMTASGIPFKAETYAVKMARRAKSA